MSEYGQRVRLALRGGPSPGDPANADPAVPRPPSGADRWSAFRQANILMYHRVARDPGDPFSLCVSPDRFADQLRALSSRSVMVSLDDVHKPGRLPRVALTFDDGYADNLFDALPILERFGAPVTVFITSRMVGSTTGFWWDRLARALLRPDRKEISVRVPGGPIVIATGTDIDSRAALAQLRMRLLPLRAPQIDAVVEQLYEDLDSEEETVAPSILTEEQLRSLAEHPLVTIGSHTTDHSLLKAQSPASQFETIAASKTDLERALGVEVRHFAYPFGDLASFDRTSMRAVRQSGFATACSALAGCVTRWSDPMCLPRRMVLDWDADAFTSQLESWGVH